MQAKEGENLPEIVYHTHNKKTDEYYHLFIDRKKATDLAKKEKEVVPHVNFRIVKHTETYEATDWI